MEQLAKTPLNEMFQRFRNKRRRWKKKSQKIGDKSGTRTAVAVSRAMHIPAVDFSQKPNPAIASGLKMTLINVQLSLLN